MRRRSLITPRSPGGRARQLKRNRLRLRPEPKLKIPLSGHIRTRHWIAGKSLVVERGRPLTSGRLAPGTRVRSSLRGWLRVPSDFLAQGTRHRCRKPRVHLHQFETRPHPWSAVHGVIRRFLLGGLRPSGRSHTTSPGFAPLMRLTHVNMKRSRHIIQILAPANQAAARVQEFFGTLFPTRALLLSFGGS